MVGRRDRALEIDLHIHSKYSPDSRSKPEDIVKQAISCGLGAIAVTDHHTVKGGKAAVEAARRRLLVITGAEIKTDLGDLQVLFIDEDIKARAFFEVVDEARAKGGLLIVPHVCASPRMTDDAVQKVDCVEVFNSIHTPSNNQRSLDMAKRNNKPGVGSSDAHMISEIGNGRTRIPDCSTLEEARREIVRNPVVSRSMRSSPWTHRMNSAVVFALKGFRQRP